MPDTTPDPREGSRTPWPFVVDAALFIAASASVLAAFNGLPRFEMGQLAAASGAAVLACAAWAFGGPHRLAGVRGAAWAWTAVVAVVSVSAVHAAHGDAWDQIALFALPLALLAPVFAPVPRSRAGAALTWGVAAGAVVAGAASAAQAFGVRWPPDVPFDAWPGPGASGVFDSPHAAGAWFAVAAPLAATLVRGRGRAATALSWCAVALAGAGVGLAAHWTSGVALAAGTLAGGVVAARDTRDRSRLGRLLLAPIVAVACWQVAPKAPAEMDRWLDRSRVLELSVGREWPYAEHGTYRFLADTALAYALGEQPFGGGAAGFAGAAARYDDDDHPHRLAHAMGAARRSPLPLVEIAGDYGFAVAFVMLGILLWAAAQGWRAGAAEATAALVALGAAWVCSPGGLHPGVLVAGSAAAALALTAGRDEEVSDVPRGARVGLVRWGLAAAIALAAWPQVGAVRWGIAAGGAQVFYGHARIGDAEAWALRAAEIQPRYQSSMNAAMAWRFAARRADTSDAPDSGAELTPEEARALQAAAELEAASGEARPPSEQHLSAVAAYEAAVRIRPDDPVARFRLAEEYLRGAVGRPDQEERLDRGRRMLSRVATLAPNDRGASRSLAHAATAQADARGAVAELQRFAARPVEVRVRVESLLQLAQVAEDELEDPRASLEALRSALELGPDERLVQDLEERIDAMEAWIETGTRPADAHQGHQH